MQTPIFLGTGTFYNGIDQHGRLRLSLLRNVYVSGSLQTRLKLFGKGQLATLGSKCAETVYSESLKNWRDSLVGGCLQPSVLQSFARMPSFPPKPPRDLLALICIPLSLMLYSLDSEWSSPQESKPLSRKVAEYMEGSRHEVDWP